MAFSSRLEASWRSLTNGKILWGKKDFWMCVSCGGSKSHEEVICELIYYGEVKQKQVIYWCELVTWCSSIQSQWLWDSVLSRRELNWLTSTSFSKAFNDVTTSVCLQIKHERLTTKSVWRHSISNSLNGWVSKQNILFSAM